jgi:hypothetical protein
MELRGYLQKLHGRRQPPYWLSFYAHDPKRVAWLSVIAY